MTGFPTPSRRTTRRTLLAGGAGVVAAGAVGAGFQLRKDDPASTPRISPYYTGMNISGLEDPIPEGPSDEQLDNYYSYGVRRVRLPGRWDFFQPKVNGPLDEDYLKLYLASAKKIVDRGMTVVLEPCHNYGKRLIDGVEHGFGDGVLTPDLFADFWTRFVRAAGDLEGVDAWEPMGEPSGLPGTPEFQSQSWADAANAAVVAIRDTGDDRTIKIDVSSPGSHLTWAGFNVALHTVTDPLDKLVFSNHVYMDRNNSGKYAYWDEELDAGNTHAGNIPLTYDVGVLRLKPFAAWLRKHKLKGEIGEIGVGWADSPDVVSSSGWQIALDTALKYCKSNGIPVYAWGAGPHLIRPYELSLEPANGLPAPQWQVLSRYLPLTELAAPTLAVPSEASTELTVSTESPSDLDATQGASPSDAATTDTSTTSSTSSPPSSSTATDASTP